MKILIIFSVFIGTIIAKDLLSLSIKEVEKIFDHIKFEDLPYAVQQEITNIKSINSLSRGDTSNYCCGQLVHLNDSHKIVIEHLYHMEHLTVLRYMNVKIGHESCGFLGMTSCTRYSIRTHVESQTVSKHKPFSSFADCDKKICCEGYINLFHTCMTYAELLSNPALVKYAQEHINDFSGIKSI
ncbi:hypothetical protein SNEBB_000160 [Seison nebaliae]|nr:hypothetical protein SNEBB_000160 [Seison nebaliae]